MRRSEWTACTLTLLLSTSACGDDTSSSGATTGDGGQGLMPTTGGAATSAGGAGGSAGAAGDGGGGAGGSAPFVDPLRGTGTPSLVTGGYEFTEGPVWLSAQNVFRFSDIPASEVWEIDTRGGVTLWRSNSNGTNGNAVAPDGSVIMCEGDARRLVQTPADAPNDTTILADAFEGLALNRPNDAIVRSDGTIYFTDPNYSLSPNDQELAFQGVFRRDPAGDVSLVFDELAKPNGIGLSPDESVLYVTDAEANELWRFDVAADGSTSTPTKIADTAPTPDGFAVDDQGYLYLTTADGVSVHTPEGELFGTIEVPEQPSNCTFGGSDRRTLLITARTSVYSVELNVPGLP